MYRRFFIFAIISVLPLISLMTFSRADASLSVLGLEDSSAVQTQEAVQTQKLETADVSEPEEEEETTTEDETLVLTPTEIENAVSVDGVSDEALSSLLGEVSEPDTGMESVAVLPDLNITYDMPVVPTNEHVKKYIEDTLLVC